MCVCFLLSEPLSEAIHIPDRFARNRIDVQYIVYRAGLGSRGLMQMALSFTCIGAALRPFCPRGDRALIYRPTAYPVYPKYPIYPIAMPNNTRRVALSNFLITVFFPLDLPPERWRRFGGVLMRSDDAIYMRDAPDIRFCTATLKIQNLC